MTRETLPGGYHRRLLLLACLFLGWLLLLSPTFGQAQEPIVDAQLNELLSALQGNDPLAQEQAGQRLAEVGPPAIVPQLREIFLASDNPRPAAIALAGVGTPTAMTALTAALADEELTLHRNAAQVALLEAGEDAIPALRVGLQDNKAATRRHSAELLGFIKSGQATNSLLRTAHVDPDPTVRVAAAWALGEIGDPRIRQTMLAIARSDPDPQVRIEAQRAALRVGEMF